jgi:hypothetical protein
VIIASEILGGDSIRSRQWSSVMDVIYGLAVNDGWSWCDSERVLEIGGNMPEGTEQPSCR